MLIFPEINFAAHFQNRSNRDAFLESEGKIHEGGHVKEFFCKLAGWPLTTSLRVNLFKGNFQGS